tara:strand:+ start:222 stop:1712 length:1491 start_codon:yes stop_codon:yes gene_type:complete
MNKHAQLILLLLCFFISLNSYTQEPNLKHTEKWYFGYGAGLDFSSGEPVPLTDGQTNMDSHESSFVANDDEGNLLFYGNFGNIWNKNHEVLAGSENFGATESVTQIQCIKQPGNDSLYYIFHPVDIQPGTIYYSIININADNGLGALISSQELVSQPATQGIGAVLHCNGEDVWIATKQHGEKHLLSWLLTESGLELTPFISNDIVQVPYTENVGVNIVFSPNGEKACVSYLSGSGTGDWGGSSFDLYEFNNCTGEFYNAINIPHSCVYGINFSPDNSKLYIGSVFDCVLFGNSQNNEFVQYDITDYDATSIINSKYTLLSGGHTAVMDMRNAPDGKMYVCDVDTLREDIGLFKLGVINAPNALGEQCNYLKDTIDLEGFLLPSGTCEQCHLYGLPEFLPHYFNGLEPTTSVYEFKEKLQVSCYPNPVNETLTIRHDDHDEINYFLIDIQGEICKSGNYIGNSNTINMKKLPNGMYILKLQSNNNHNIFTFKISKL